MRFFGRPRQSGFTLIEILMVTSLVGVIGLALFQSLSNGIKIWKRNQQIVFEEDVALFFEKLERDLHNVYCYSLVLFEGRPRSVDLPTFIRTKEDAEISGGREDYIEQMGKVRYAFDPIRQVVLRAQANYGQAVGAQMERPRVVASSIPACDFYYYDIEADKAVIRNKIENRVPVAVRVDIRIRDEHGHERSMTRLIRIPTVCNYEK